MCVCVCVCVCVVVVVVVVVFCFVVLTHIYMENTIFLKSLICQGTTP